MIKARKGKEAAVSGKLQERNQWKKSLKEMKP